MLGSEIGSVFPSCHVLHSRKFPHKAFLLFVMHSEWAGMKGGSILALQPSGSRLKTAGRTGFPAWRILKKWCLRKNHFIAGSYSTLDMTDMRSQERALHLSLWKNNTVWQLLILYYSAYLTVLTITLQYYESYHNCMVLWAWQGWHSSVHSNFKNILYQPNNFLCSLTIRCRCGANQANTAIDL